MSSFNEENIIDVDYNDINNDKIKNNNKIINGEPLFYTTTQVSEMVGVEPSTIRFWTKRFERLLDIEVSNRNKQYKKSDVEKLKFIKKLAKEDGLTLQQIEDYAITKGFDMDNIEKNILDSSNPLAIQTFIAAMTVEIDKKLNIFSENLLNKINEQNKDQFKINFTIQQEMNDKLQETIALTVDEIVTEKLNTKLKELSITLDAKEQEAKNRDVELLDTLRKGMEDRKRESEIKESQKKGFWVRLFKKKI